MLLYPHLPVRNVYFIDLIGIFKMAKGCAEKGSEAKEERNGEKAEETEICGSIVTN